MTDVAPALVSDVRMELSPYWPMKLGENSGKLLLHKILLLGLGGTAWTAGHLTAYRGHGRAGSYSGVAIQSGPLTFYEGPGLVGSRYSLRPARTYRGARQRVGNSTIYRGY